MNLREILNDKALLVKIILVLAIILLIKIKFFGGFLQQQEITGELSTDIYATGQSKVPTFHFPKVSQSDSVEIRLHEPVYNFNLLYVLVHDDSTPESALDDSIWKKRTDLIEKIFHRESLGKINCNPQIVHFNVKQLGDKKLDYSKRNIKQWLGAIDNKLKPDYDYEVIALFTPLKVEGWCRDAPSFGFNINNTIELCQEVFGYGHDSDHTRAVGLLLHKMWHGIGYHHRAQELKPLPLLEWYLGLPESHLLPHASQGDFDGGFFFDRRFYKILGYLEQDDFDKLCLDSDDFICVHQGTDTCRESAGPYCSDSDKDGILDSEDSYVFSSPLSGKDSDSDGIVDKLDLCDNDIKVSALKGDFTGKEMKLISKTSNLQLEFASDLEITKIVTTYYSMINGFLRFPEENSITSSSKTLSLEGSGGYGKRFWRVQVFYTDAGQEYYRPFYVYFGENNEFVYEREWYYFNRFGCGVPSGIDLSAYQEFDSNHDGLPDADRFAFASDIDDDYDWDNDGVPDVEDTLPTVTGSCSDSHVQGVKDTDKDGFCDPGNFRYTQTRGLDQYFEIRSVFENPESDLCPFLPGEERGCPNLDNDGVPWYEDPCPLDNDICFYHSIGG